MQENIIEIEHVSYAYDEDSGKAVDDVTLSVPRGAFIAVLGQNGSGKSTLAKLMNGLYLPTEGTVRVEEWDTTDDAHTWDVRQRAGMVFQNPDNQLVATIVRDDVAFGLENTGVPTQDMPPRIEQALRDVNMTEFAEKAPHHLSGGQKQRVAIAGVLAMQPDAIIFDEATAMLDPIGRRDVFDAVKRLNKTRGLTVVWITHFMEEAAQADQLYVMHDGRIVMQGTPKEVFRDADELEKYRLTQPPMTRIAQALRAQGVDLPEDLLTVEEMVKEVKRLCE